MNQSSMNTLEYLPFGARIGGPTIAVGILTLFFIIAFAYVNGRKKKSSALPPPPEVPGLPVLGNLLQLKEKKPHKTFTKWAKIYGPIYSIRTGSNTMVVLNSKDVAKEAMIIRYSSISTRKLSNALKILSGDKTLVAVNDYNEFYKGAKRHLLASMLGSNAQKRHCIHRDTMMQNVCEQFHAHLKSYPFEPVNFKKIFQYELFGLALKQVLGKDVDSIFVEKLHTTLSKDAIFEILVSDPMKGAIDVDWRDFFPYLKWIPNKRLENKIKKMDSRRQAVMESLIDSQKKRIASGEEINSYIDYLSSEPNTYSEQQKLMLLWEPIIETSDTTLITTEWAMYELSKNPEKQNRLFMEIQKVCGEDKLSEESLCQLPYLHAVFQETLRKYSPISVIPLRYADKDVEIGGYTIPAGSEIAINIYGCNMDEKVWENPEEWVPERFLNNNDVSMELHKTMAFGAGKRVCAGALQAMVISCVGIGRLIEEFEWILKDGEEDNVDTLVLTSQKLHPMLAFIKSRN